MIPPPQKREAKDPESRPIFDLNARDRQPPSLEKKPYYPERNSLSNELPESAEPSFLNNARRVVDNEGNITFERALRSAANRSGYISPTELVTYHDYVSPLDLIKYKGSHTQNNDLDYYSALDIIGEYGDYELNGRKGYWAEDIVKEAMPSAYHANSGDGYWAEDIVREAMPDAYEIYSNQ